MNFHDASARIRSWGVCSLLAIPATTDLGLSIVNGDIYMLFLITLSSYALDV